MVRLEQLKLYTQTTDGIRFVKKGDEKYLIVFMSENSSYLDDHEKLNIKPMDVKYVSVPYTKIPRTVLTPDLKKRYKYAGLNAIQSNIRMTSQQNLLYDPSEYINTVDKLFRPQSYRLRAGSYIKNVLNMGYILYPGYKKVFVYSVNLTKPLRSNFTARKIFPILQDLKNGNFEYDYFVFNIITESGSKYRLLVKDKEFKFNLVWAYIRSIVKKGTTKTSDITAPEETVLPGNEFEEKEPEEERVNIAANKVMNHVIGDIAHNNIEKVKGFVTTFFKKNVPSLEKVESSEEVNRYDAGRIAISAILNKTINNASKSMKVVKKVKDDSVQKVLKKVDSVFTDQYIEKKKVPSTSTDPIVKMAHVDKLNDHKNPSHLFEKRSVDFQTNLKKDIESVFKVLETRDTPLKVESVKLEDAPSRAGELNKSEISLAEIKLRDQFGGLHIVRLEIPKINTETGVFTVNGKSKCLINQIVPCPISFPSEGDSKFESAYSTFHIESKVTKKYKYLRSYIGSFRNLPLLVVTSFMFGFENVMKLYDIKFKVSDVKPEKTDKDVVQLDSTSYLYFYNIDNEVKSQLCNSLIQLDPIGFNVRKPILTREYFEELLHLITGTVAAPYHINRTFENILDPASKQVLIIQGLPHDLDLIIKYMSEKVVTGYKQDRNDLSNLRIRGSEIIAHLIVKAVSNAYTVYHNQVLAGNKKAIFEIREKDIRSAFLTSDIVSNMEYANPVEEMAVMLRISPVGKGIGGIKSKEAVSSEYRNVHSSYFGNIDPLDTPEGQQIGVVQQLTLDSDISSARGVFKLKDISEKEGAGILSTASALIPFTSCNDGNRIMFSCSQQKQMLPLKNPEPPIIMTGYESILTNILTSNFIKRAPSTGKITEVNSDRISMVSSAGSKFEVDLAPIHLSSGSGRDTLSVFTPKVKVGQSVKEKDIIAEGSSIKDGTISLGRNLLVAYMPYKGYSFDDGIILNDKLVKNEKLVSLHAIIEEVLVSEKDRILYIIEPGTKTEKGDVLLRKTIGEIEELLGFEEDESTVVYGQDLIKKSPGGVVVDVEVFANVDISKYPKLKELSERTKRRYGTAPREKFSVSGKNIKGVLIKFKIQQELNIMVSDKMTGRYGNKGVVCYIEEDSKMPRCYDKETEIFTNNGWKKFADLSEHDKVAYVKDLDNHIADFIKPISYFSKHYKGTMFGAVGKRIDYLVTHHHRMYCKTKYEKFNGENKFNIKLAEEIHGKTTYHLANMDFDLQKNNYNDKIVLENITTKSGKKCISEFNRKDFCEFLGWYISEGSLGFWKSDIMYKHGSTFSYKIQISQCRKAHPEECKKIENLLNRMGLKWTYHHRQYTISNKSIYNYLRILGKCNEKYIPLEILKESNREDLKALFIALIDGDGSYIHDDNYVYYTTSKRLADDISTLSSLLGYHCSAPCVQTKGRKLTKYCIYIYPKENIELSIDRDNYYNKEYDDMIYCVEVPNGLLLVRRNGKQFWCGNTPWGETVDIILNPLGVIGRMNVGQIYETYCGLISKSLAGIMTNNSKDRFIFALKHVLPLIDGTKNKEYSTRVIEGFQGTNDTQYMKIVESVKQRGFFPIIIPPFKSPGVGDIKKALDILGLKAGYNLYLPEFGVKTTNEVPVGYLYMSKLEHIGSIKMHARSTGPVTSKTGQPTAGKRREGGQRLGELDSYSIISYNVPHLLSELFTSMSDDIKSKNEMVSEIVQTGECKFRYPQVTPAKDLMGAYFLALMLDRRGIGE